MPHSPATTRAAPQETAALTAAMKDSGRVCDLSDIPGPKVDKHSTGGVGDKTSLILAPIVASLGAVVPMMSGRGLGHTGGTLDKLESIPGFNVSLSTEEFKKVLRSCGAAIVGTTPDMAPADKKMYASPLPPLPQEIQYPRPNP
jgi:pyrimidine-nucleoside phosphorylase